MVSWSAWCTRPEDGWLTLVHNNCLQALGKGKGARQAWRCLHADLGWLACIGQAGLAGLHGDGWD